MVIFATVEVWILGVNLRECIGHAANTDDHPLDFADLFDEKVGKQEMAEVVRREMTFDAFLTELVSLPCCNTRIVDQNVNVIYGRLDSLCCLAN